MTNVNCFRRLFLVEGRFWAIFFPTLVGKGMRVQALRVSGFGNSGIGT